MKLRGFRALVAGLAVLIIAVAILIITFHILIVLISVILAIILAVLIYRYFTDKINKIVPKQNKNHKSHKKETGIIDAEFKIKD